MVSSYCHLGHVITNSLDDEPDIMNRQNSFIGQVNTMMCFFDKLSFDVKIRLFHSYCTSYYGCTNCLNSVPSGGGAFVDC